jgi:hypothetical protein
MNLVKKREKSEKPTSAGHVSGFGFTTKCGEYYQSDPKTRKERRSQKESREVQQLREQVAQIPQLVEDQVAKRMQ